MDSKIAVVGAGLCGTLLAIRLAQRGFKVDLYEKRPDLRKVEISAGRSINLALSDRGLKALKNAGIEAQIKDDVIPMKGRMIHDKNGNQRFSPYSGRSEDYINSISRGGLNAVLLDEAEKLDEIELYFDHSCEKYDPFERKLYFNSPHGSKSCSYDQVFGADGAGSEVRKTFMELSNRMRFNFQQHFLTHGYKELEIPAGEEGRFRIEKNALHIWPRDEFMMIALPNLDGSFTVTLFHPFKGHGGFDSLVEDQKILNFFNSYYPDAVQHMPELIQVYHDNPTSSLGTIKCYPWHIDDRVLLIGDAVHAIVPFYGQGMNCAFEDVYVLDQFIDQYPNDWGKVFEAYSEHRKPDTDAIADLALDNFYEMQDKVNDEDFIQKRKWEMLLEQTYPDYYSKYSLVTFQENIRYHKAMEQGRFQDEFLLKLAQQENAKDYKLDDIYKQVQAAVRKHF